jgi:glucose-1-phosphate cytidylyltransferase
MKVVLFCGGMGLRMRDGSPETPKPMIQVGDRPILFHIMKYYAHYGHKEFILCLGYQAHVIKEFFIKYRDALSNDFVLSEGGRAIDILHNDIEDWRITFVDTGLYASIGQRLKAVQPYIGEDEMFLANYADVLTDTPLPTMIANAQMNGKIATFLCVRPTYTFHVVAVDDDNMVTDIHDVNQANIWINGGYFIFRREIFDYLGPGEDLVNEPLRRLIAERELLAYRHDGFWAPMDTFKDRQTIQAAFELGQRPWAVWESAAMDRLLASLDGDLAAHHKYPAAANGRST